MFSLSLVIHKNKHDSIDIMILALFWSLLISFFVSILLPSIGIDDGSNDPDHLGLWQGIFGFKNILGRVSAFFIILLLFQKIRGVNYKYFIWIIPVILLVMSKSTTPFLSLIAAIGFIAYVYLTKKISTAAKIIFIPIAST
ncbi:hypothetical protein, partial [Aliivibrio kagoshimensis]|uniref:hypothetical protein n=1 Tax=Aliivibrio kagoshimensis TaxID=2910230 RepID=UPI003D127766